MTKKETVPEFKYEVILQEDPESKDLILPIPPELMRRMGWKEGDDLNFDIDDRGQWVISKK